MKKTRKVKRFDKKEDETIKNFVNQYGEYKGIFLAAKLLNRNKIAVQNRYTDFICRKEFSAEETQSIIFLHDSGMKFCKMKMYFPGRTPKMLQVQYKAAKMRLDKESKINQKKNESDTSYPILPNYEVHESLFDVKDDFKDFPIIFNFDNFPEQNVNEALWDI